MTAFLLLPPFAILLFVALGYRRRWLAVAKERDTRKAQAQHWFDEFNRVNANHHRLVIRNLFSDEARV